MKNPASKICSLASYGIRKQLKDFVGRLDVAFYTEDSPELRVGFIPLLVLNLLFMGFLYLYCTYEASIVLH